MQQNFVEQVRQMFDIPVGTGGKAQAEAIRDQVVANSRRCKAANRRHRR